MWAVYVLFMLVCFDRSSVAMKVCCVDSNFVGSVVITLPSIYAPESTHRVSSW